MILKEFYLDIEESKKLPVICYGTENCCNPSNPCPIYHGDCSSDADCIGIQNICGKNNCQNFGFGNRTRGNWDEEDDCCEKRCTPEHPCQQGYGDCDTDDDCENPNWQTCVAKSCLNPTYFPVSKFPKNIPEMYVQCTVDCPSSKGNHAPTQK